MGNNLMLVSEKSEHLTNVYNFLCHALMDVVHIDNVNDAKAGLKNYSPAFILLDFDIKGLNSLLSDIVFSAHLPQPYIMIASKYRDGNDRANMLDRGADSCVDKPINGNEVIAVINSVLRRNKQIPIFSYKELAIHRSCRMVTMHGEVVALTKKEYDVLCLLANHVGIVLTKEEIYRAVWKDSYNPKSTNVSDHISSLRCKLGLSCKDTTYIHTVVGVGYRFGGTI